MYFCTKSELSFLKVEKDLRLQKNVPDCIFDCELVKDDACQHQKSQVRCVFTQLLAVRSDVQVVKVSKLTTFLSRQKLKLINLII